MTDATTEGCLSQNRDDNSASPAELPSADNEHLPVATGSETRRILHCGNSKFHSRVRDELESYLDGGQRLFTIRSIRLYQERQLAAEAERRRIAETLTRRRGSGR